MAGEEQRGGKINRIASHAILFVGPLYFTNLVFFFSKQKYVFVLYSAATSIVAPAETAVGTVEKMYSPSEKCKKQ